MDMNRLLRAAVQFEASDLHIQVDSPPIVRRHGTMNPMELPPVTAEEIRALIAQVADREVLERLDVERSGDFSYLIPEVARFRVNVFYELGRLSLVARVIPLSIKPFEALMLPPAVQEIAEEHRGLVLVTGTTGSGKSTTLAAMIDFLNRTKRLRIITIEDPVEFVHTSQKSLIAHREIGRDSPSFAEALRRALRQDPDVILVGEIRDRDTAQMALSAAETGHMVFSTLHTRDAKGAITRFTDLFPQGDQREVRAQLSLSLRAIVSQHLLPSAFAGQRRVLALEILFNSLAIAAAIRTAKIESVDNVIVTSRADGMITLDESIKRLLKDQRITRETAERFASATARL
jgi:twitching motility protein PilT